ncbi:hypothetical protein ACEPPU_24170 [Priestia aryabhattai]|uniref:hypothetical protein n=1 Tax=Priestia aryabhattai TaxID=412384 RepID=UPI0035ABD0DD
MITLSAERIEEVKNGKRIYTFCSENGFIDITPSKEELENMTTLELVEDKR